MDEEKEVRAAILKYYAYRATTSPGFIWPISILFVLHRGLSYTEIGTISTALMAAVIIGELPTGYIGDRIGRRNSMILSSLLFSIGQGGIAFAYSFEEFLVLNVIIGLARTFKSGSVSAWLYDTLSEHDLEERYTHVRGRGESVRHWTSTVTMIGGGVLYVIDPIYPFICTGALSLVGAFVLLSLPKNAAYTEEGDGDVFTVLDALPVIRARLSEPPLRSFVIYAGLFAVLAPVTDNFIQPITVDAIDSAVNDGLFVGRSFPEPAFLGVMYAGFTGVRAVASDHAANVKSALGVRKTLLFVPVLTALVMLLPLAGTSFAVGVFFAIKASESLVQPIISDFLNGHVESFGRATVLSAASMVYSLIRIPFFLLGGVAADLFTPVTAVAGLGLCFLVGTGLLFTIESPFSLGRSGAKSREHLE